MKQLFKAVSFHLGCRSTTEQQDDDFSNLEKIKMRPIGDSKDSIVSESTDGSIKVENYEKLQDIKILKDPTSTDNKTQEESKKFLDKTINPLLKNSDFVERCSSIQIYELLEEKK